MTHGMPHPAAISRRRVMIRRRHGLRVGVGDHATQSDPGEAHMPMPGKLSFRLAVFGVAAVVAIGTTTAIAAATRDTERRTPEATSADRVVAPKDRVLEIKGTPVNFEMIDVGTPGLSLGDQIIVSNDFVEDGKKIGFDAVVCSTVRVAPVRMVNCNITMSLPDGLITAQVLKSEPLPPAPSKFVAAITGGTGAYRDARGQIDVDPTDPNKPPTHYFTVTLEDSPK
jgi:hypothetical protein